MDRLFQGSVMYYISRDSNSILAELVLLSKVSQAGRICYGSDYR